MDTQVNSTLATRPVPRSRPLTLPEQIAESITMAILNGDYGPGDRIVEQQHAEQFQVSRGPIREALRILEKSGVVTILAQRGAHVTRLSAKEVNDLFQIRRELAGLFFRGAALDPIFLEQMEQDVVVLERLAQEVDSWVAYTQATMRLSRFIYSACPNEKLTDIYHSLALQTARYTKLGLRERDRRLQSARGWRLMLDALKKNRVDEAGEAMKQLIDHSRLAALEALQADSSNVQ